MNSLFAECRILDAPYHADRPYTYNIPRDIAEEITAGTFVTVPFGGGNRKKTAVVTSTSDSASLDGSKCKPIISVTMSGIALSAEEMATCDYLTAHTLCSYGDAVRAAIPQGALSRVREIYAAAENIPDGGSLPPKTAPLLAFIREHGPVPADRIRGEFGDAVMTSGALSALCKKGFVTRTLDVKEPSGEATEADVRLLIDADEALGLAGGTSIRSKYAREALRYLAESGGEASEKDMKAALGPIGPAIKSLVSRGLAAREEHRAYRNPFAKIEYAPTALSLSEHQTRAYETLSSLYGSGQAKAALLYGVTGSGKTSVIRAMIDRVTSDGRGVIILVPEIALTPQTVGVFCSNYGGRVAVIHSSLSAGERVDAWRRIRDGEADIVIGTRSAVFAPVKNLGLVVIDEEQEHTYKSDSQPKYSAHDVARFRCAYNDALLLLSSATPSLSSYYKTTTGAYTLVKLTERYGGARMPDIIVADMRRDRAPDSSSPLGMTLRGEIEKTISAGEQAILFLNRRGYNNFLSCRVCGRAITCPRCSVAMTYHARRPITDTENRAAYRDEHIAAGYLECHYCGYRVGVPRRCPDCGGEDMFYMGWGTQRVEQELGELFPTARVLRMDADTTRTKSAYDDILGAFGRHDADILIGTQMVTKGHDFPDVTLVGVLLAESSLYLDDYRAAERTFSLITQSAGRAGRADRPGRAVIQTYTPDNASLGFACRQDYEQFYDNEIRLRRAYSFPPFCDIAQVTLTSADESVLSGATLRLSEFIKKLSAEEFPDVSIVMFGPFEAPVYRVNGRCRMRVVCKCRLNKRTRELFSRVLCEFGARAGRSVSISVDFNPTSV